MCPYSQTSFQNLIWKAYVSFPLSFMQLRLLHVAVNHALIVRNVSIMGWITTHVFVPTDSQETTARMVIRLTSQSNQSINKSINHCLFYNEKDQHACVCPPRYAGTNYEIDNIKINELNLQSIELVNQPINQSIRSLLDRSINHSTNHSINKSINHRLVSMIN